MGTSSIRKQTAFEIQGHGLRPNTPHTSNSIFMSYIWTEEMCSIADSVLDTIGGRLETPCRKW